MSRAALARTGEVAAAASRGRGGFGPLACAAALVVAAGTFGDTPELGGPMVHLIVDFDGAAISVYPESTGPLVLHRYDGVSYDGEASILDDRHYNAQFGWLVGGFWFPPPGTAVFIERLASTAGLEVYDQFTFEPIHGSGASPSATTWNGVMRHNWYAADAPGTYTADYRVYIGDPITAMPVKGYGAAELTLSWIVEGGAACPADLDADGSVDAGDLAVVLAAWGATGVAADLNRDGLVDAGDLAAVLAAWGACG